MSNKNYDIAVIYFNDDKVLKQELATCAGHTMPMIRTVKLPAEKVDKKMKFDMSLLRMAEHWSENSYAKRRKVGCIIAKDYNIISDGYNGMPTGFDNTTEDENGETKWEVLHAESNAIAKLAKSTNSSLGSTLYITFSPCKSCAKMIVQSGIVRVVYTHEHSDTEGIGLLLKAGVKVSRYFLE